MAKYSFEMKLEIVKEYLLGRESQASLAKKYGVNGHDGKSRVRHGVNTYQQFGEEGLLRKRKNETYPIQFKLDAIEWYLSSEWSILEVANQFGINKLPLISSWLKKYREKGIEGLSVKKGRLRMQEPEGVVLRIRGSISR